MSTYSKSLDLVRDYGIVPSVLPVIYLGDMDHFCTVGPLAPIRKLSDAARRATKLMKSTPYNAESRVSKSARSKSPAADTATTQLSKLNSVLNGLEHGASAMRRKAQQLMQAVRSGTYEVDSMQLSRRIVGDALHS